MTADVIIPAPVPDFDTFEYIVLENLVGEIAVGQRVLVPFGEKNIVVGIVKNLNNSNSFSLEKLKNIISILEISPFVNEFQFRLWEWISAYYRASLSEICHSQTILNQKKPFEFKDENSLTKLKIQEIPPLSAHQQTAFEKILQNFETKNVVLLHGVTSSGKTEVYIHLIKSALEKGEQVLYLVPEIALTTQLATRLQRVFGDKVLIFHSKFTPLQRAKVWGEISKGKSKIVLGARSAIFLPFNKLRLVIVDEEHDASFKQYDPAPRYHARNTAIILAQIHGAKTLLGTATPSVESYFNAKIGKYALVEMTERFEGILLPEISLIDLTFSYKHKEMKGHFSVNLINEINKTLSAGEQVILFQNRRGYAPYVECPNCGWIPKCPNCDVNLTYHKKFNKLSCHYCGFSTFAPSECPICKEKNVKTRGFGTEQIEQEVSELFPETRAQRMDLDTITSRKKQEKIIDDFAQGKVQILIGTQIVTKGLDFGNVGLVGVLNADNLLNFPDFRAQERTFQMLAQVSGRAGRKRRQGRVIIQTSSPQLPVIEQVKANDYQSFYAQEIAERKTFNYPPFSRLISIEIRSTRADVLARAAHKLCNALKTSIVAQILGPANPPVSRINKFFIKQILIKINIQTPIEPTKKQITKSIFDLKQEPEFRYLRVDLNIDPM